MPAFRLRSPWLRMRNRPRSTCSGSSSRSLPGFSGCVKQHTTRHDSLPSHTHHIHTRTETFRSHDLGPTMASERLTPSPCYTDIAEGDPLMPDMTEPSDILTEDHRRLLCQHLPARAEGYSWSLIYSTARHGFSLKTLYREMGKIDTPILLVIQDTNGSVFGALTSHPLRTSDLFYGTGESFLFTFYPDFEKFGWTGFNQFFIKGNCDSLVIGAGKGNYGIWLDEDLCHGRSQSCETFANPRLSKEGDFVVKAIECWTFV